MLIEHFVENSVIFCFRL